MREAAKAKADAERQAFLASKGKKAGTEVADAKPAKKITKIIEPVEPIDADPVGRADPGRGDECRADRQQWRIAQRGRRARSRQAVGLFAGLFGGTPHPPSISRCSPRRARSTGARQEGSQEAVQGEAGIRAAGRRIHRLRCAAPSSSIPALAASISSNGSSTRPPLCHRGRPRRPAVQGHGRRRRQAGMAALDPDAGHAEARARSIWPVQGRHARRRPEPARRPRHLSLRRQEGHASAHPRHHRAADDRNQRLQWLLPHDQRARHGPLQPRAGSAPRSSSSDVFSNPAERAGLSRPFCFADASSLERRDYQRLLGKKPSRRFFLWRNQSGRVKR